MADQSVRLYSLATRTSGPARSASMTSDAHLRSVKAPFRTRHPASWNSVTTNDLSAFPGLRGVHHPRCFTDALLGSSSAVLEPNDRQGLIEREPVIAIPRRHKKRKNTCKASTSIPEKRGWEPR